MAPEELYKAAKKEGDMAGLAAELKYGDVYPCGFAWINIKPARGPFVKFLKEKGIGRTDSYLGGYSLSSYDCCAFNGQNMDIKEAGVKAFADVLRQNGISANVYSRMD